MKNFGFYGITKVTVNSKVELYTEKYNGIIGLAPKDTSGAG
tara:strand:+ start:1477 stop:1599 length:123 start_codon:yes stop_codon:yes gene_type:complete